MRIAIKKLSTQPGPVDVPVRRDRVIPPGRSDPIRGLGVEGGR
jgi:hypothetical protein